MTKGIKDLSKKVSEVIIKGIQEKKGNDIVSLDLRELKSSFSDFFIIAHAESSTQVRALADSVQKEMFLAFNEEPFRKEGFENAEWILLDYVNVVVHLFKLEKRQFYGVEELWGDAIIQHYKSA